MIKVTTETILPAGRSDIWQTLTDLKHVSWRRDLDRLSVLNRAQFLETDKSGLRTFFTVTRTDPGRLWELALENSRLRGTWQGRLTEEEEGTRFTQTHRIQADTLPLKLFGRFFVKRMQKQYADDLKAEVLRRSERNHAVTER